MKLETRLRARLFFTPPVSPYSYGPCCGGCVPPAAPGAGDPRDASDGSPCSSHSRCDENPRSRGRGDSENDQERALL